MRLIDADKLNDGLKWRIRTPRSTMEIIRDIVPLVNNQPTAYCLENVVKQLEERTEFLKDCTKYGNKDAAQQEKSYSTMMMYEVAELVDDLIDIVKGGGAGASGI